MAADGAEATRSAPEALSLESAKAHVRAVMEASGTSFGPGMRILPKPRREAMFAVYAFCREIDDIADEGGDVEAKRAGLAAWRDEIARLYAGRPAAPTSIALAPAVEAYGLERREFELLIEGMEMDAEGPIQAPPLETLYAYTRRVAGAVGKLSMPIFGAAPGEASDRFALALGDAFQLTNILRDVREDAEIDRLYLPQELIRRAGIETDAPAAVAADPRLGDVCAPLARTAWRRFEEARGLIDALGRANVRPALVMMGVYETYLAEMEARGWARAGEPVQLPKWKKLAAGLRYAFGPPAGVAPPAALAGEA
ncbi:MAG: presqualene diphosphate synthase HpnD [Pseudomonadota bacterium]